MNEPDVVGVPLSTPPNDRFIPWGKEPEAMDQVYGGFPPAAARVCEYAVPITPDGIGELVVIVSGIAAVRLKAFSAVRPPLSVT